MKQPILSIIIPTRDNIEALRDGFLRSFVHNTGDVNNVELIFVVDEDDKKTINFISNEKGFKQLKHFQLLIRKRSLNITDDYYNYGAKKSNGFFVMPGADDIVINTPNYDLVLIKVRQDLLDIEGIHKKHYLLIKTYGEGNIGKDPDGRDGHSGFPILTRDSIDRLGYFLAPAGIPGWGADWFIDTIYTTLNKVAATNPPINIAQVSQHSNKKNPSEKEKEKYRRMKEVYLSAITPKENPEIWLEILRAIHYIVLDNLEKYTPKSKWMKYEANRVNEAAATAVGSPIGVIAKGSICPHIYEEILIGIQQALYRNFNHIK